jgi:hypothetical protein
MLMAMSVEQIEVFKYKYQCSFFSPPRFFSSINYSKSTHIVFQNHSFFKLIRSLSSLDAIIYSFTTMSARNPAQNHPRNAEERAKNPGLLRN